jgi:enoyl-CoA hydratase/carnithine racemase
MDAARKKDLPGNLPASLHAELRGEVAVLRLSRPQKRNALDDDTVAGIEIFFRELPSSVKAVVLHGEGDHFSAGLDLNELTERDFAEAVEHSRGWHRIFEQIEFGKVPVVSVLHGAVVGGGLELACATHVRVAETSTYYGLPEGTRGIFVGGGGSVRIPRIIGISRMMEMMLTGRTYGAEEGQVFGLSHHLVAPGEGLKKGLELAAKIATNTALTNFAIIQGLPRIAEQDRASGYLMESLIASLTQSGDEAKARLRAFLEKRAPKVVRD